LPPFLHQLFSKFPLHTYPPVPSPFTVKAIEEPTLWVHPPQSTDPASEYSLFSSDVECLKWQAYIALRGLSKIALRWDVSSDGAMDGRLPNLHSVLKGSEEDGGGQLLPAHLIAEWVDEQVGGAGPLEGYVDQAAKDESRAWVALLEGNVHAALVLYQKKPVTLSALLSPYSAGSSPLETLNNVIPLTGLGSLIPSFGTRVDRNTIELRYREAIASLSERLGTDKYFLGSSAPTALDALAFAYLHCLLYNKEYALRFEAKKRVNLVAWEQRVQSEVRTAFHRYRM